VLRDAINNEVQYQHENYDQFSAELEDALAMPSDSTALDSALQKEFERGYDTGFLVGADKGRNFSEEIKQAKRKALIEAANRFLGESHRENTGEKRKAIYLSAAGRLSRMAEELK
jgi:hypothetical protein